MIKPAHGWFALGILLLGLVVRWPHLRQSLWFDEMTTVVDYVAQPWQRTLAARRGEYVANNHVLHTILVKLVCSDSLPINEAVLRLPALLAGLLVPLALAWPMRYSNPWIALLIALVATLHPWLVDFSVQARGYSLLLLLGIIGTNLLPVQALPTQPLSPRRRVLLSYSIVITLAIYTVPLALLLIPAHAITVLILQRSVFVTWLQSATIAVLLAALLYLPMYRGLLSYYHHPFAATMNYRQFLNALPRCAFAGVSPPNSPTVYWALPTIAIVIGSVLGWSHLKLRPLLLSLSAASLLGILLPLISSAATEPRFVPWILPWFCLAVVAALASFGTRWGAIASVAGFVGLISWQAWQDVTLLPQQQIREGIQLADRIVPPGRDIMVLYLGARESIGLYGNTAHRLLAAPDTESMIAVQRKSIAETGHLPWVIIYYEKLARDRDLAPAESHGLWRSLITLYDVKMRLPGRLTPVAIFQPKPEIEGMISNR